MNTGKIFFSYSRGDSKFALGLANDLRAAGADIWIDQLDIPAGMRWEKAVEQALTAAGCLLVILTPLSAGADNVSDEIAYALDNKKKVIPVLQKECTIPFRIRSLQFIDFTKDYPTAFNRLLKELNIAPTTNPPPAPRKPFNWKSPKIIAGVGIVAVLIVLLAIYLSKNADPGTGSLPPAVIDTSGNTVVRPESKINGNWNVSACGVGNNIYFFARYPDNRLLYNSTVPGQAFTGWKEIEGNGRAGLSPAAGAVGNHVFVIVKGLDDELYLNQADLGRPFNDFWASVNFKTDVAAAATGVGNNIYFFAKDLEGRIFYNRALLGEGAVGWAEVDGNGKTDMSPAAGAVGSHVFVVIKDPNGELLLNQADLGRPFNNFWAPLNFKTNAAPAATGVGNSIYFFAKNPEGRVFYNRAVLGQGGVGWAEVEGNGKTNSSPAAGAVGNRVFVLIKGLDGKLYYNQADEGGSFGEWVAMDF